PRTKSTDRIATRTDRVSRRRTRAAETTDCQAATHAIRAFFGEAGSADRTTRVAARGPTTERCGESRCSAGTTRERRAARPTGATTVASTPTTGSANLSAEARSLPGLRWKAEASWRRCF